MTEERIVETETPAGNTHTTHTVITDEPRRSGGAGWAMVLLVLVVAVVGIFFLTQMSDSEAAKDNAVAEAAGQVGDAVQGAGEAVEDAVTTE